MKRILSLFLIAALVTTVFLVGGIPASAAGLSDYVSVTGYDPDTDYMQAMQRALNDGSSYALQVGAIYEKQRTL